MEHAKGGAAMTSIPEKCPKCEAAKDAISPAPASRIGWRGECGIYLRTNESDLCLARQEIAALKADLAQAREEGAREFAKMAHQELSRLDIPYAAWEKVRDELRALLARREGKGGGA